MHVFLRAANSTSNTTSSATASKQPTSVVWPLARACSNAPTNQARVAESVSPTNAESNVIPAIRCRCLHYRVEKALALSGKVPPSMLGLSYVLLVFLTYIPLKWFTSASTCGMTLDVTGAHILLSLSPTLSQIRAPALTT